MLIPQQRRKLPTPLGVSQPSTIAADMTPIAQTMVSTGISKKTLNKKEDPEKATRYQCKGGKT